MAHAINIDLVHKVANSWQRAVARNTGIAHAVINAQLHENRCAAALTAAQARAANFPYAQALPGEHPDHTRQRNAEHQQQRYIAEDAMRRDLKRAGISGPDAARHLAETQRAHASDFQLATAEAAAALQRAELNTARLRDEQNEVGRRAGELRAMLDDIASYLEGTGHGGLAAEIRP